MVMLNAVIFPVLWTLCVSQSDEVQQEERFKTAKLGETVVIKCMTKSIWRTRLWYKLGTDRSLHLLTSTTNVYETKDETFYSVQTTPTVTTLTITGIKIEDVGTYYCGILNSFDVLFGSGTVLEIEEESVQSKSVQSVVHSPNYIRVHQGDSVTLNCSFISSQSKTEHIRVTWVKISASEIISWNNINENFCSINAVTKEIACVHNMTLRNVSSTADGTYLCVVTACGHTRIGNGTRIHVHDDVLSAVPDLSHTVLVLTVLNVAFGLAVVVLVWLVYSYRKNEQTEEDSCHGSNGEKVEDEITYAGVNVMPWSVSCRSASVTPRQDTVVYSEVRYQCD